MRLLFTVAFVLFINKGFSQVLGCTDPLATNFNANANRNDGSCVYSSTKISPYSSTKIQNYVFEISGLVKYQGAFWAHNDNSDRNLYQLDSSTGFVASAMLMKGGLNRDWEDVCADDSFIYMGDVGNNFKGNRRDLTIYKWRVSALADSFEVSDSIRFHYPEQIDFSVQSANTTNFDCEAMVAMGDSLYLFTKEWAAKGAGIYRLSKDGALQAAQKIGYLPVDGLITGAAYWKQYNTLALVGYSDLLQPFIYLIYDMEDRDFSRSNKRKIQLDLPFYQVEAVEWVDSYTLVLANESFSNSFIQTQASLHYVNLSFLLGDFYGRKLNTNTFVSDMMRFEISQNPGHSGQKSRLWVRGANRCVPIQQEIKIMTESGMVVKELWLSSDSMEMPEVTAGLYLVGNSQLGFVKWVVQ